MLQINCNTRHSQKYTDGAIPLPGKIIVSRRNSDCNLYFNNTITAKDSFYTSDTDSSNQYINHWLNTKDFIVATTRTKDLKRYITRTDILLIDTAGIIVDTIFSTNYGMRADPEFASSDDRYLALSLSIDSLNEEDPIARLAPWVSLVIWDMENKKEVARVDNVCQAPSFWIWEYPWLKNQYKLLYNITQGPSFVLDGIQSNTSENQVKGIYIFDVPSAKSTLIVPEGENGIASPVSNKIAYVMGKEIKTIDLDTGQERVIFEIDEELKLFDLHWTPDGTCLYFAYGNVPDIGIRRITHEKLINVNTLEEQPFSNKKLGFKSYTWK